MRRAVVVLNVELPPRAFVEPYLVRADFVVGADGGANRLLEWGIEPDAVVGDFDSLLGSTRRRLPRARFHQSRNPNDTDLEKALKFVKQRGAGDVTILAGAHRRFDHTLGHAAILLDWRPHFRIRLVDHDFVTEPVVRRARFRAPVGTVVSLFSPSEARGVTTRGLRWPLVNRTLRRGTRGIHNQVQSNPVEVSLSGGELLLFRGHRVEPHA